MRVITLTAVFAVYAITAQAAVKTTTTSASSIQTESAKIAEVAPSTVAPKKWSLKLESENNKTMTSANNAYSGDIEAYQYLHVGYKLADKLSTSVVSTWTQRLGYEEQSSDTTFEDIHARLTRSDLFQTSGMSWTAQGRLYFPTSRLSNEANLVTQARAYLIGSSELAKNLSLELIISPRYYIYENDNRTDGKSDWRILNSAGVKYSINDMVAVETTLGVYSKQAVGAPEMAHFQDYSTSVYVTPVKNFELNAGIRATDGALDIDTDGVELYNHQVSEYFLIGSVSL